MKIRFVKYFVLGLKVWNREGGINMAYRFDYYRNQDKEVQISSPDSEVALRLPLNNMQWAIFTLWRTAIEKRAYYTKDDLPDVHIPIFYPEEGWVNEKSFTLPVFVDHGIENVEFTLDFYAMFEGRTFDGGTLVSEREAKEQGDKMRVILLTFENDNNGATIYGDYANKYYLGQLVRLQIDVDVYILVAKSMWERMSHSGYHNGKPRVDEV